MQIGLMIGPERGRSRHKVAQLVADAEAAERDGFASIWVPQIPGDFDAFTAITLMGQATERIELGTAVLPIQTRHPVAMAQAMEAAEPRLPEMRRLGLENASHYSAAQMASNYRAAYERAIGERETHAS